MKNMPMCGAFLQQRCRKLPFPEKMQKIFRRAVLIFLLPKCTRHRRELWQNAKKKNSGTLPFGSVSLLSSSMLSPVQPNVYARHTAARLRHTEALRTPAGANSFAQSFFPWLSDRIVAQRLCRWNWFLPVWHIGDIFGKDFALFSSNYMPNLL